MKSDKLFSHVTAGLVFCLATIPQAQHPKPDPPKPSTPFSNVKEVIFEWSGVLARDYHYQVGTTPGGNDKLNDDTLHYLDVLFVPVKGDHGQTFYARIRYRDLWDGEYSPWSDSSNPASIDLTPPSLPGIPVDEGEFSPSPNVLFTWTPSYEPESGINKYDFLVTFTQGFIVIEKGGTSGKNTAISVESTHATTVKAKVMAFNNSYSLLNGYLSSGWTPFSDGITIDLTPPSAPGTPTDMGDYTGSSDLTFHWSSATEDVSGISCYHITISDQSTNEIVHQNNFIRAFQYTAPGVGLHNHAYSAKVRAQNGATTWGDFSVESNGITVDLTPPSAPGTPTDAGEFTSSPDIIFNWTAATDSTSGIIDYHLQVGTTPGDSNAFNQWIGLAYSDTIACESGNTYYARVRAKNGAGAVGDWSGNSDGITVGILLSLPSMQAFPGDTIRVPLYAQFPNRHYDAAEISFINYHAGLQFIDIDTSASLVGAAKWSYIYNETEERLQTAFAGAQDITGTGVFCRLRFLVVGDICTLAPITIESALFNTGQDSAATTDGSVYIKPVPFYGDVDENSLVQAHDAAFILKYLVGVIETLTCQQFYNADVTLDSTVSALDATVIMQYVVGLIDSLPYVPGPEQLIAAADVRMEYYLTSDQIIEIPIHLTGCDNVLSFEGCVTYDPENLTFMDVLWSSELGDFTIYDANANGVLRLAGAGARPYQGGEAFARVRFRMDQKSRASATIVALRQFRLNENDVQDNVAECHVALASDAQSNAASIPTTFSLEQNYPNPFNARTTIQFALPHRTFVKLSVYDLLGREIAILVNEELDAGVHKADFDADDIGSGLYYYRFETSEFSQTRKLLVLK